MFYRTKNDASFAGPRLLTRAGKKDKPFLALSGTKNLNPEP